MVHSVFAGLFIFLHLLFPAPVRAQEVHSDTINRMVAEKLQDILAQQGAELTVEEARYRYSLRLPDGEIDCLVESDSLKGVAGQQSVAVAFRVNGRTEKRLRIPVSLKLEFKIPVARTTLQRGAVVGADDLDWRTIAVTRTASDMIRDVGEVVGLAANRRIPSGVPLLGSWFERPLAVARGERVRVVVAGGPGLQIEATAVALDKGRVGDVIQLRNPDSQMRYEARIAAPGLVRVGTW
ncbi:MAG: flagellar basal body P-ring formation protein FlgA [Magnetococcales bacterium]|nr:flagellar basal body P-ring formation protein FlgA [Magnetococcales bacterium]